MIDSFWLSEKDCRFRNCQLRYISDRVTILFLTWIAAEGEEDYVVINRLKDMVLVLQITFMKKLQWLLKGIFYDWVLVSSFWWLITLLSLTSPSRVHGRPFWGYLTWVCLFFWPPSANLHSNGSAGATEWVRQREREGGRQGQTQRWINHLNSGEKSNFMH